MIKPTDDFFKKIWDKFKPLFFSAIGLELIMSNQIVIDDNGRKDNHTKYNPLNFSKRDQINFMKKFELQVKDANATVSKRINDAVINNISIRGSNNDLVKDIKNIFDEEVAGHLNYKNRFKTIARTESANLLSVNGFNKAKELGATSKYLSGVSDNRQGGDSKVAIDKYGKPDQAIPLNEEFVFSYGNAHYRYLLPPNRPNDREIVLYTYD